MAELKTDKHEEYEMKTVVTQTGIRHNSPHFFLLFGGYAHSITLAWIAKLMVLLNWGGSHVFVEILQLFSSYALSSPFCHILFQGNVASQSFTLVIAQLKNSCYTVF